MQKKRLLTRLVSGAVVVAVTTGSALLVSNAVASADPPPGTLGFITLEQPVGTNLTAINSNTSGPCPTTSNRADLQVVGPIGVPADQQIFPATNPFTAVTPITTQYSQTTPFRQQWRVTFQDAVQERLGPDKPVPTGEYDFTANCLPRFGSQNFGTFTGGLFFDTSTTYHSLPNAMGNPSPSPVPTTGALPSPEPTSSASPSPVPTTGALPSPEPTSSASPTPEPSLSPSPSGTPTPTPTPEPKGTAWIQQIIRAILQFFLRLLLGGLHF